MPSLRCARPLACLLIASLSVPVMAAQAYPNRPVRLIVPYSPGSSSDAVGRVLARGLTQSFGQQVIVENRAGAAGGVGAELAAKAPADGYAILLVNMAHVANALLHKKLDYDLRRDFEPVTQVATSPFLLVVHPSLPARSLPELVKLVKARPGDIAYGSIGVGTPTFLAGELFKQVAGVNLLNIPYRSGSETIVAVLGGEVSVFFAPVQTALPNVRQEKLRALAVTSSKRIAALPEFPTVAELGYPGYQTGDWYGLVVPAKTPMEIVAAIRGATLNALQAPETGKALTDAGYVLIGDEPDEFAAHIRAVHDKLVAVLKNGRLPRLRGVAP